MWSQRKRELCTFAELPSRQIFNHHSSFPFPLLYLLLRLPFKYFFPGIRHLKTPRFRLGCAFLAHFDLSSRSRRARDAERTPEFLRMRLPPNFAVSPCSHPFHSMSQVECREVRDLSSANSRQSLDGIQFFQLQAFPLHHNLPTKHSLRSLELSILYIRSAKLPKNRPRA